MRACAIALLLALLTGCMSGPQPSPEASSIKLMSGSTGRVPSADGVPITYSWDGRGSPALVFIHGWSCDRGYWDSQVEPFLVEHKVVAVDLAGHGSSGSERSVWSLAAFGQDVRSVVELLDLDRVILIGHSMGGPVALEAAQLMPERVMGVIGVDSLHDAELGIDRRRWQEMLSAYEKNFEGTCRGFVGSMFSKGADPELVQGVQSDMCAAPPELAIALLRLFPDYDMRHALSAVQAPIRCINTASVPTNLSGNRKYARDFDAVIMEGVGHFPMLERPEEFNHHLAQVIAGISARAGSPNATPID